MRRLALGLSLSVATFCRLLAAEEVPAQAADASQSTPVELKPLFVPGAKWILETSFLVEADLATVPHDEEGAGKKRSSFLRTRRQERIIEEILLADRAGIQKARRTYVLSREDRMAGTESKDEISPFENRSFLLERRGELVQATPEAGEFPSAWLESMKMPDAWTALLPVKAVRPEQTWAVSVESFLRLAFSEEPRRMEGAAEAAFTGWIDEGPPAGGLALGRRLAEITLRFEGKLPGASPALEIRTGKGRLLFDPEKGWPSRLEIEAVGRLSQEHRDEQGNPIGQTGGETRFLYRAKYLTE